MRVCELSLVRSWRLPSGRSRHAATWTDQSKWVQIGVLGLRGTRKSGYWRSLERPSHVVAFIRYLSEMARRLEIAFDSQGFSPGSAVSNGPGVLKTSWDELVWSALTVGRPNRQYVFRNGIPSVYEALFRTSLLRMAIEQAGPTGWRLRRTTAAKTLDPTEKGAINYFLGLAISKLFASRLLATPWLMHLDVFRPQLNPVLSGRSRPDLVGEIKGRKGWIAMECKGRLSVPDATTKQKAKQQALRLQRINGQLPVLHIGAFAYFRSDVLEFYWEDPLVEGPTPRAIEVESGEEMWRHYYSPTLELVRARHAGLERSDQGLVVVEEADIQVGILPEVLKLLEVGQWNRARLVAEELTDASPDSEYHPDGIRVIAGPSWVERLDEEQ